MTFVFILKYNILSWFLWSVKLQQKCENKHQEWEREVSLILEDRLRTSVWGRISRMEVSLVLFEWSVDLWLYFECLLFSVSASILLDGCYLDLSTWVLSPFRERLPLTFFCWAGIFPVLLWSLFFFFSFLWSNPMCNSHSTVKQTPAHSALATCSSTVPLVWANISKME